MTSICADLVLSQSAFSHVVDVPIEAIDIADWLFTLPGTASRESHNRFGFGR
jgi:hypothetical protein